MTGLWLISYVALWILLLVVMVLLVGVLRHIGILYQQTGQRTTAPSRLPAGKPVPDLALSTPEGDRVRLSQFAGTPTNFVVVSTGCSTCSALLRRIAEGETASEEADHTVILSTGNGTDTRELIRAVGLPANYAVLVDAQGEIDSKWGIRSTPVTIVVDQELRMIKHVLGTAGPRRFSPQGEAWQTAEMRPVS